MQNKIDRIIAQTAEKSDRLCTKTERQISLIELQPNPAETVTASPSSNIGTYWYGAASICAMTALVKEDMRGIGLAGAAIAAGIGYFLSKGKTNAPKTANTVADYSTLKTKLTSEIIAIAKAAATEWEEFISIRQEEVKKTVSECFPEREQKEELLSKLYFYETIKIPYTAFSTIIERLTSNNIAEIKEELNAEIKSAIKNAADTQINSYKHLWE